MRNELPLFIYDSDFNMMVFISVVENGVTYEKTLEKGPYIDSPASDP